jgi:hypothetical protein
MFFIQGRSEAILLQILNRPIDELGNMFNTNYFAGLPVRDKVVEDGGEIARATANVQDSGAGLEERQKMFAGIGVL